MRNIIKINENTQRISLLFSASFKRFFASLTIFIFVFTLLPAGRLYANTPGLGQTPADSAAAAQSTAGVPSTYSSGAYYRYAVDAQGRGDPVSKEDTYNNQSSSNLLQYHYFGGYRQGYSGSDSGWDITERFGMCVITDTLTAVMVASGTSAAGAIAAIAGTLASDMTSAAMYSYCNDSYNDVVFKLGPIKITKGAAWSMLAGLVANMVAGKVAGALGSDAVATVDQTLESIGAKGMTIEEATAGLMDGGQVVSGADQAASLMNADTLIDFISDGGNLDELAAAEGFTPMEVNPTAVPDPDGIGEGLEAGATQSAEASVAQAGTNVAAGSTANAFNNGLMRSLIVGGGSMVAGTAIGFISGLVHDRKHLGRDTLKGLSIGTAVGLAFGAYAMSGTFDSPIANALFKGAASTVIGLDIGVANGLFNGNMKRNVVEGLSVGAAIGLAYGAYSLTSNMLPPESPWAQSLLLFGGSTATGAAIGLVRGLSDGHLGKHVLEGLAIGSSIGFALGAYTLGTSGDISTPLGKSLLVFGTSTILGTDIGLAEGLVKGGVSRKVRGGLAAGLAVGLAYGAYEMGSSSNLGVYVQNPIYQALAKSAGIFVLGASMGALESLVKGNVKDNMKKGLDVGATAAVAYLAYAGGSAVSDAIDASSISSSNGALLKVGLNTVEGAVLGSIFDAGLNFNSHTSASDFGKRLGRGAALGGAVGLAYGIGKNSDGLSDWINSSSQLSAPLTVLWAGPVVGSLIGAGLGYGLGGSKKATEGGLAAGACIGLAAGIAVDSYLIGSSLTNGWSPMAGGVVKSLINTVSGYAAGYMVGYGFEQLGANKRTATTMAFEGAATGLAIGGAAMSSGVGDWSYLTSPLASMGAGTLAGLGFGYAADGGHGDAMGRGALAGFMVGAAAGVSIDSAMLGSLTGDTLLGNVARAGIYTAGNAIAGSIAGAGLGYAIDGGQGAAMGRGAVSGAFIGASAGLAAGTAMMMPNAGNWNYLMPVPSAAVGSLLGAGIGEAVGGKKYMGRGAGSGALIGAAVGAAADAYMLNNDYAENKDFYNNFGHDSSAYSSIAQSSIVNALLYPATGAISGTLLGAGIGEAVGGGGSRQMGADALYGLKVGGLTGTAVELASLIPTGRVSTVVGVIERSALLAGTGLTGGMALGYAFGGSDKTALRVGAGLAAGGAVAGMASSLGIHMDNTPLILYYTLGSAIAGAGLDYAVTGKAEGLGKGAMIGGALGLMATTATVMGRQNALSSPAIEALSNTGGGAILGGFAGMGIGYAVGGEKGIARGGLLGAAAGLTIGMFESKALSGSVWLQAARDTVATTALGAATGYAIKGENGAGRGALLGLGAGIAISAILLATAGDDAVQQAKANAITDATKNTGFMKLFNSEFLSVGVARTLMFPALGAVGGMALGAGLGYAITGKEKGFEAGLKRGALAGAAAGAIAVLALQALKNEEKLTDTEPVSQVGKDTAQEAKDAIKAADAVKPEISFGNYAANVGVTTATSGVAGAVIAGGIDYAVTGDKKSMEEWMLRGGILGMGVGFSSSVSGQLDKLIGSDLTRTLANIPIAAVSGAALGTGLGYFIDGKKGMAKGAEYGAAIGAGMGITSALAYGIDQSLKGLYENGQVTGFGGRLVQGLNRGFLVELPVEIMAGFARLAASSAAENYCEHHLGMDKTVASTIGSLAGSVAGMAAMPLFMQIATANVWYMSNNGQAIDTGEKAQLDRAAFFNQTINNSKNTLDGVEDMPLGKNEQVTKVADDGSWVEITNNSGEVRTLNAGKDYDGLLRDKDKNVIGVQVATTIKVSDLANSKYLGGEGNVFHLKDGKVVELPQGDAAAFKGGGTAAAQEAQAAVKDLVGEYHHSAAVAQPLLDRYGDIPRTLTGGSIQESSYGSFWSVFSMGPRPILNAAVQGLVLYGLHYTTYHGSSTTRAGRERNYENAIKSSIARATGGFAGDLAVGAGQNPWGGRPEGMDYITYALKSAVSEGAGLGFGVATAWAARHGDINGGSMLGLAQLAGSVVVGNLLDVMFRRDQMQGKDTGYVMAVNGVRPKPMSVEEKASLEQRRDQLIANEKTFSNGTADDEPMLEATKKELGEVNGALAGISDKPTVDGNGSIIPMGRSGYTAFIKKLEKDGYAVSEDTTQEPGHTVNVFRKMQLDADGKPMTHLDEKGITRNLFDSTAPTYSFTEVKTYSSTVNDEDTKMVQGSRLTLGQAATFLAAVPFDFLNEFTAAANNNFVPTPFTLMTGTGFGSQIGMFDREDFFTRRAALGGQGVSVYEVNNMEAGNALAGVAQNRFDNSVTYSIGNNSFLAPEHQSYKSYRLSDPNADDQNASAAAGVETDTTQLLRELPKDAENGLENATKKYAKIKEEHDKLVERSVELNNKLDPNFGEAIDDEAKQTAEKDLAEVKKALPGSETALTQAQQQRDRAEQRYESAQSHLNDADEAAAAMAEHKELVAMHGFNFLTGNRGAFDYSVARTATARTMSQDAAKGILAFLTQNRNDSIKTADEKEAKDPEEAQKLRASAVRFESLIKIVTRDIDESKGGDVKISSIDSNYNITLAGKPMDTQNWSTVTVGRAALNSLQTQMFNMAQSAAGTNAFTDERTGVEFKKGFNFARLDEIAKESDKESGIDPEKAKKDMEAFADANAGMVTVKGAKPVEIHDVNIEVKDGKAVAVEYKDDNGNTQTMTAGADFASIELDPKDRTKALYVPSAKGTIMSVAEERKNIIEARDKNPGLESITYLQDQKPEMKERAQAVREALKNNGGGYEFQMGGMANDGGGNMHLTSVTHRDVFGRAESTNDYGYEYFEKGSKKGDANAEGFKPVVTSKTEYINTPLDHIAMRSEIALENYLVDKPAPKPAADPTGVALSVKGFNEQINIANSYSGDIKNKKGKVMAQGPVAVVTGDSATAGVILPADKENSEGKEVNIALGAEGKVKLEPGSRKLKADNKMVICPVGAGDKVAAVPLDDFEKDDAGNLKVKDENKAKEDALPVEKVFHSKSGRATAVVIEGTKYSLRGSMADVPLLVDPENPDSKEGWMPVKTTKDKNGNTKLSYAGIALKRSDDTGEMWNTPMVRWPVKKDADSNRLVDPDTGDVLPFKISVNKKTAQGQVVVDFKNTIPGPLLIGTAATAAEAQALADSTPAPDGINKRVVEFKDGYAAIMLPAINYSNGHLLMSTAGASMLRSAAVLKTADNQVEEFTGKENVPVTTTQTVQGASTAIQQYAAQKGISYDQAGKELTTAWAVASHMTPPKLPINSQANGLRSVSYASGDSKPVISSDQVVEKITPRQDIDAQLKQTSAAMTKAPGNNLVYDIPIHNIRSYSQYAQDGWVTSSYIGGAQGRLSYSDTHNGMSLTPQSMGLPAGIAMHTKKGAEAMLWNKIINDFNTGRPEGDHVTTKKTGLSDEEELALKPLVNKMYAELTADGDAKDKLLRVNIAASKEFDAVPNDLAEPGTNAPRNKSDSLNLKRPVVSPLPSLEMHESGVKTDDAFNKVVAGGLGDIVQKKFQAVYNDEFGDTQRNDIARQMVNRTSADNIQSYQFFKTEHVGEKAYSKPTWGGEVAYNPQMRNSADIAAQAINPATVLSATQDMQINIRAVSGVDKWILVKAGQSLEAALAKDGFGIIHDKYTIYDSKGKGFVVANDKAIAEAAVEQGHDPSDHYSVMIGGKLAYVPGTESVKNVSAKGVTSINTHDFAQIVHDNADLLVPDVTAASGQARFASTTFYEYRPEKVQEERDRRLALAYKTNNTEAIHYYTTAALVNTPLGAGFVDFNAPGLSPAFTRTVYERLDIYNQALKQMMDTTFDKAAHPAKLTGVAVGQAGTGLGKVTGTYKYSLGTGTNGGRGSLILRNDNTN